MYLIIAVLIAAISALPIFIAALRRGEGFGVGAIMTAIYAVSAWAVLYLGVASGAGPLLGVFGVAVMFGWIASAISSGTMSDSIDFTVLFPVGLGLAFLGLGVGSCSVFRSAEYAGMIGQVAERDWAADNQPADPAHLRLVSRQYALYLATKQLGEAGAIGSQFQVSPDQMTVQKIKNELWWVVPLDFASYGAWSSTDGAPGYIMVHAESPSQPPKMVTGKHFRYTPGAYFGHELERCLRANGYLFKYLTDYSMEIDENGQAWWVVTVARPTIGWSGEAVDGVVIVNPESGENTFHELGKIPDWVDRVFPVQYVDNYIDWKGTYHSGWWNSFWDKKDLTEGGHKMVVYGSDGQAWWAFDVTSTNGNDDSIVGLMYVNCRTGEAVRYSAKGGTQEAAISAANQKVTDMRYHGSGVTFANIYGQLTAVVPISAQNFAYQGVALVRLDNLAVGYGKDVPSALREYQRVLAATGGQSAVEAQGNQSEVIGVVTRIGTEVRDGNTLYSLRISDQPKFFTGTSELSPELVLTQVGDQVKVKFVSSGETMVPMMSFDNLAIDSQSTPAQQDVDARVEDRRKATEDEATRKNLDHQIDTLSPEQREAVKRLIEEMNRPPEVKSDSATK